MSFIIPTPGEIRRARLEVNLSQATAAKIVHVSESTWQRWETDPMFSSYATISSAAWELFLLKTSKLRPDTSPWKQPEPGKPLRMTPEKLIR